MKRILILLVIALLFSGCVEPEVRYVKNSWGEVNEQYTEILTTAGVYNPLPIPLPIEDVKTEVYMNNIKMGQGHAIKANVKANSVSDVVISTKIDNDKIVDWWISHIKNNETTNIDVKGKIILNAIVTQFDYPLEYRTQTKTKILDSIAFENEKFDKLFIQRVSARWGNVNKDYTEIIVNVKFKASSINITKASYYLELNGIELAKGLSKVKTESNEFSIKIYIDNSKITNWWVSHIKNGEKSVGKIEIKPFVDEMALPTIEQPIIFETNMLGD